MQSEGEKTGNHWRQQENINRKTQDYKWNKNIINTVQNLEPWHSCMLPVTTVSLLEHDSMIAFTRLYMLMLINSHILTHYSCKSSKTDEKSWCECSQCHGPTAGNPYEEKKVHKT